MAEYLFTYGTLQPGHAPGAIGSAAAQMRPLGEGYVHGTLYDFGRYPGAVLDSSTQREIFGTIYELPDDPGVLQQLDDYEEFFPDSPELSQYLRVLHPVVLDDGRTLDCWIYIYNRDPRAAPIVESGRWRRGGKHEGV